MKNTVVFDTEESKEWLRDVLRNDTVTVIFEKSDGAIREMNCTLQKNIIESNTIPNTSTKTRPKSNTAQSVFDVESNQWKSFRWNSVKEIKFNLGEKNED